MLKPSQNSELLPLQAVSEQESWQLLYKRDVYSYHIWSVKRSSMSFELTDTCRAELKQLWGGTKVPPLTPEQIELSLKLWQKIKARKQREQKLTFSEEDLE